MRDGYYVEVNGTVIRNYHGPIQTLWSGVSLFRDHADGDIYKYSGATLKVGMCLALPLQFALNGRMRYSFSNYDENELLSPEKRRDVQFQFALGLSRMLTKNLGTELN